MKQEDLSRRRGGDRRQNTEDRRLDERGEKPVERRSGEDRRIKFGSLLKGLFSRKAG